MTDNNESNLINDEQKIDVENLKTKKEINQNESKENGNEDYGNENYGNENNRIKEDGNEDNLNEDNLNEDNLNEENLNKDNLNEDNLNEDNLNEENLEKNFNKDNDLEKDNNLEKLKKKKKIEKLQNLDKKEESGKIEIILKNNEENAVIQEEIIKNEIHESSITDNKKDCESAINDNLDLENINELITKYDKKTLPSHLRIKLWKVYLKIDETNVNFPEIFDLPNQKIIRSECQKFVQKLSLDQIEEFRIQSDLEQIITALSKNLNVFFHPENGWLDILRILLPLKLQKAELYKVLENFILYLIPKNWEFDKEKDEFKINNQASYLFRLLLLYFDPELCSFLDTKKITPEMCTLSWFKSLFALHSSIKIIQAVWDIYLQKDEPLMVFYISLVMLVNIRDQLFEMKDSSVEEICSFINSTPNNLDLEDIEDLYYLIENFYISHTPKSIKGLNNLIFYKVKEIEDDYEEDEIIVNKFSLNNKMTDLSQLLCLPVSVSSMIPKPTASQFRFFVVDCRPAEHYNNGHFSTAFHLDCSLMLQEPNAFNTAIQALLVSQQQAINAGSLAGGKHLCFLGSGRDEEDRYLNMVVASFLQKKQKYVSIAYGGYEQLHSFLSENNLMNYILEHNRRYCLPCSKLDSIRSLSFDTTNKNTNLASKLKTSSSIFNFSNSISTTLNTLNKNINVISKSERKNSDSSLHSNDTNDSIFDKFASTFKNKSQGFKEKLADIISNPNSSLGSSKKHVSSNDLGKRYNPRNFSIADDENLEESDNENDLEINVEEWSKKNDAIAIFNCKELKNGNSCYPSFLVLTETHLFILREIPHNKGYAKIVAKRPLDRILQITSKKKRPDIITIRYGQPGEGNEASNIMISDLLSIQRQNEVIEIITKQVSKL